MNAVTVIFDNQPELPKVSPKLSPEDIARLKKRQKDIAQQESVLLSREKLLAFARLMTPDQNAPKDLTRSGYVNPAHIELILEALEKVEAGEISRLIITMPPRHGKSQTITRLFPPWFVGRDPTREVIIAGYSQKFAETSFGRKIQALLLSDRYREVFPAATLDGGSKAVGAMTLAEGGNIIITGRDGALTGHGAHLLVIDDPFKNRKEAESQTLRDSVWEWFTSTAMTRVYDSGAVIIVMTRWNEDDLVGRITNPDHPDYDPDIARGWTTLALPAVFEDKHARLAKALGKKTGDVLWPRKGTLGFTPAYFAERKRLSPEDFEALYQGEPSPADGEFFRSEWLHTYSTEELPRMQFLNVYGASDHAVTTRRRSDATIIGCVGVDSKENVYVLPDLVWAKLETDKQVDEMVAKMRFHKPFCWFIESENISKAFGPFLLKRMQEERVYTVLEPKIPSKDKVMRAQPVRGLMAHGKVKFPRDAWWFPAAKKQLLNFPNGASDDFVDFLSWIGRGLLDLTPGKAHMAAEEEINPELIPGTVAWFKASTRRDERNERLRNVYRNR